MAVIRNQNVLKSTALNSLRGNIVNIDIKSQKNKIVYRILDGRIYSFSLLDSTLKEEGEIELYRTTIDSIDYRVFSVSRLLT